MLIEYLNNCVFSQIPKSHCDLLIRCSWKKLKNLFDMTHVGFILSPVAMITWMIRLTTEHMTK